MAKESVLTESEKDSFQIEKFIFHIIIQQDFDPIYLEEVALTDAQKEFFKKRFNDISEGTQYVFQDKDKSDLYRSCSNLMNDPANRFLEISKKITYSFKQFHNKNTNDGVFITALVSVQGSRKLIFLLKLDHRTVYQYKITRNRALLEEIKNTFVEDKKAIQKAAIIDISDHYKWDVLAKDRTATNTDAGIRDYFAKFLTVTELETPSKLTENAVKFANKWAIANLQDLDPEQEVSSYKSRAISYLLTSNKFDTEDFINTVILDSDPERRERLSKSFKSYLDEYGLTGQSFVPTRGVLTRSKTKNVRQTAEGIKIEWEGEASESNLTIAKESDGYYHIRIKTSDLKILDSSR
ncbi:MAG TPA: nucleoid-associated protein [Sphingobacteriaceae bacterium]